MKDDQDRRDPAPGAGEAAEPLAAYRAKRDFGRTPEPGGAAGAEAPAGESDSLAAPATRGPGSAPAPIFCVQKHHARQLHYDFRLEMAGVLKSWAVPKGPSLDPEEKRFAARTEDHPREYATFEGVIPPDNYGAGSVLLWDHGTWEHLGPSADPVADVAAGKLDFLLHGHKLAGRFALVRMGGSRRPRGSEDEAAAAKDWLLLKKRDAFARPGSEVTVEADYSVKSGLSLAEIAADAPAVWNPATRRLLESSPHAARTALPAAVSPSLATLAAAPPAGEEWLHELKHDGVRVIAHVGATSGGGSADDAGARVRLVSRSGRDQTALYPEIAAALAALVADTAILDGEIVTLDANGRADFQRLQPRMQAAPREVERLRREVPVVAFLFDLLYLDGYDLRRMPIEERKAVLAALLDGAPPALLYSDHVTGQGAAFFELAAQSGVEGIVSKRLGSPYTGRRTTSWLKVKRIEDREFVIGGFTAPQGSRPHFGALLIGLYDDEGKLHYVTRVGSGFDDANLATLHRELVARERPAPPFVDPPAIADARWAAPELVARVKYAEWTRDGGLRAPVFLGLAPDVAPGDCRLGEKDREMPVSLSVREEDRAPAASAADLAADLGADLAAERAPAVRRGALVDLTPRPGEVRLANPDKVLFPDDGITKRDIFAYFRLVAPVLLPHLADRPLSLQRWPDGIAAPSFFQKDAPDVLPPYVRTVPIAGSDDKRPTRFIIADSESTLLWLANLTAFTLHPWGSRLPTLEHPDFMILDLDPKDAPFATVVDLARELAALLDAIGLRGYPKTTGSSGLHIYVPLAPEYSYDQVRSFAELLGHVLVARRPEEATLELKVDERKGRVFVDYLRNQMGQTAAGPYVVRALPGAPVSAPLSWDEVNAELAPRRFTIRNMAARLEAVGDLWAPVRTDQQHLEAPLAALAGMLGS